MSPSAGTAVNADPASPEPVYVVVHLDVEPHALATALPIVEALRSQEAYREFVDEPYVKAMRDGVQPYLGAPFDERYHRRVAP